MRYLGEFSGAGMLKCDGEEIVRATYELGLFHDERTGLSSSGEIRLSSAVLEALFGRQNIQLLTDDGRLLDIRFSGKTLLSASEVAHVDVTGELPTVPHRH